MELKESDVTIVGTGALAQTISLLFVQSGVRRLHLVGEDSKYPNKYGHLLFEYDEDRTMVENIKNNLERIHKGIQSHSGPSELEIFLRPVKAQHALETIASTNIIVDATNDTDSKKTVDAATKARGIPVLFCSATLKDAVYSKTFDNEALWAPFENKVQGPITSGIIGGYVAHQIDLVLSGHEIAGKMKYTLPVKDSEQEIIEKVKGKKIFIIGAGALGNVVCPTWGLLGADVTVVDFDKIESKNMIHQYFYHNLENDVTLEKHKVDVFSKRLEDVLRNSNSQSKVKSIHTKIETAEQLAKLTADYDMICLSVDNDSVIKIVSDYLIRENKKGGVASIGGTSDGQALVYSPGKTMCLYHTGRYANNAGTCVPGVQTAARVVGSLSVGEGLACLLDQPLCNSIVRYDQTEGFYVTEISIDACSCIKDISPDKDSPKRRGYKITPTYRTRLKNEGASEKLGKQMTDENFGK